MDRATKAPSVEQVAQVARLAARLMLESGGETYRAEDIANHIAHAFGLKTDIIAFPTGLTMTLTGENNEVSSVIARVDRISTDLMKLEEVNSVSRALCSGALTLEEAAKELERIQKIKPDGIVLNILYAAGGAALFALMFGGGWFEFLISGLAAAIIQLVLSYAPDQAGMPISSLFAGFQGVHVFLAVFLGHSVDVGVCFGYTIARWCEFYSIEKLLILGRVTTGKGGDIILAKAGEVLKKEFPEYADKVEFCIPDEKNRRHGQAVAAGSLPVIG